MLAGPNSSQLLKPGAAHKSCLSSARRVISGVCRDRRWFSLLLHNLLPSLGVYIFRPMRKYTEALHCAGIWALCVQERACDRARVWRRWPPMSLCCPWCERMWQNMVTPLPLPLFVRLSRRAPPSVWCCHEEVAGFTFGRCENPEWHGVSLSGALHCEIGWQFAHFFIHLFISVCVCVRTCDPWHTCKFYVY